MSDLGFNKIAGAVLATGLAIFLLREVSEGIFHSEPPEKPGYAIAIPEEGGEGGPVAEAPIDWGTVLPVANVEAGKAVSAKCASCHTFDAGGANGTGPNLYGVLGGKPASKPGFAYSPALTEYAAANPQWGYENMNAFLTAPQKHVPGTKMTFVGLKKPEERISMMAYLRSLGSSLPIPAPNPAVAAAPADGAASAAGQPLPGGASGQPTAGAAQAPTQTAPQTPAKPEKPTG